MRLIDADKLIDYFYYGINDRPVIDANNDRKIIDIISEQPTAYDVGRIVGRLEEERNLMYRSDGSLMGPRTNISIDKAIEIVKSGDIERE